MALVLLTCLYFMQIKTLSPRQWQNTQNPSSCSELCMFISSSYMQLLEHINHINTCIPHRVTHSFNSNFIQDSSQHTKTIENHIPLQNHIP